MSTSLWAQDDFQKKLSELQEKREETLYQWRTQNKFNETTLAPFSKLAAYKEFRNKLETEHLDSELKLHDESCSQHKTNCLTPQEREQRRLEMMRKLADLAKRTSTQMENVPQVPARPLVATQLEARPEVRAEVPAEVKTEVRPETRAEIRPETKSELKVNTLQTRPVQSEKGPASEAKPLPVKSGLSQPAIRIEAKSETLSVTRSEVKPEVKPDVAAVIPEAAVEAKPEVKPEVQQTKVEEVKPVVPTENEDEKSPRNYKAETCKWVNDLPRKIVVGPGCGGKSKSRICTGYVVCEQKVGGGKFVRQSTCAADKCGENDAVACTRDQYYFSSKPSDEEKQFVSPKLKEILSSEQ